MSDAENIEGVVDQVAEKAPQEGETIGALSRWIAEHPRRTLWFIVLALIPYVLLCWAVTFVMLGALLSGGGCG
jgi:hypothetical protein